MKDKIIRAYERWCQSCGASEFRSFWKFLDTDPNNSIGIFYGSRTEKLSEKGARRLEMLLGPNHAALIKAYKVQQHD